MTLVQHKIECLGQYMHNRLDSVVGLSKPGHLLEPLRMRVSSATWCTSWHDDPNCNLVVLLASNLYHDQGYTIHLRNDNLPLVHPAWNIIIGNYSELSNILFLWPFLESLWWNKCESMTQVTWGHLCTTSPKKASLSSTVKLQVTVFTHVHCRHTSHDLSTSQPESDLLENVIGPSLFMLLDALCLDYISTKSYSHLSAIHTAISEVVAALALKSIHDLNGNKHATHSGRMCR